jgi:hypothetical protein
MELEKQPQPTATEAKAPNVEKIMERFKKARDKRQGDRDEIWKELDAFDRGEQWSLKGDSPSWTPKPVTNYVHLVKYTKRAALAIENPTGKLRPNSPLDMEKIDQLQKVYEFEWEKVGLRKFIREAIETSKLLGTAITQLAWQENYIGGGTGAKFEGKIVARSVDPATFYPDPTAFTIEDCRYIHIAERKTLDFIKQVSIFKDKYNEVKSAMRNLDGNTYRGEIYSREYNVGQSSDILDFHTHYEKVANEEGGYTYKVHYIAAGVHLHTIEDLRPNRYPFAILHDFPQRQAFWAKSSCEFILDNQKLINKLESIIATIGLLLQNPQKIVSKESGINPREVAKYGNAHGHVFVANGQPSMAMAWQNPPAIPQSLFNLLENARSNIREITGLSESYMGQSVGSLQTSSGVDSLIERSTLRDRDQMFDVEMYVEDLSRLMLAFITEFYTEERIIRIDKPEEKLPENRTEWVSFIGQDFADLEFDFELDVSAKAPISRMRQQREVEKLLTIQGQYQFKTPVITPQEYIKISEFTDGEAILKRMDTDEMRNKVEEAFQVAQQIQKGLELGVTEDAIKEKALEMFKMFEEGGTGSTADSSTSGEMQMRQGQPTL